jgi:hypothetical protein
MTTTGTGLTNLNGLPYFTTADEKKALPDVRGWLENLATTLDGKLPHVKACYNFNADTFSQAAYAQATNPDRVQNVIVPTNGLIAINFVGMWKASAAGTFSAAIFIGSNQIKVANIASGGAPTVQEISVSPGAATGYTFYHSTRGGLDGSMAAGSDASLVTTGMVQPITNATNGGGPVWVWLAAGTYDISVQYKNTAGSLSIKERRLWVHSEQYS